MTEVAFGFLLYFVPLAGIPVCLKTHKDLRLFAFLVLLIAPLVGEVTYLIYSRQQPLLVVATRAFWTTALANYPMALFPLGLWAVFIALITIIRFQSMIRYEAYPKVVHLLFGSIVGGSIGAFAMWIYGILATRIYGSEPGIYSMLPYIISGISAGVVLS